MKSNSFKSTGQSLRSYKIEQAKESLKLNNSYHTDSDDENDELKDEPKVREIIQRQEDINLIGVADLAKPD
jgi:hypothetical protein